MTVSPSKSVSTKSEGGTEEENDPNCLQRFSAQLDAGLQRGFAGVGYYAAIRPWYMIAFSLVVIALCALGTLAYTEESDGAELWVPSTSPVREHLDIIRDEFPGASFTTTMLVIPPNGEVGKDMLTWDVLRELVTVRETAEGLSAEAKYKDEAKKTYTFADLCLRTPEVVGDCVWNGVPAFWDWNVTQMNAAEAEGLTVGESMAEVIANASATDAGIWASVIARYLGGVKKDGLGVVESAKVLKVGFELRNEAYKDESGDRVDPPVDALEQEAAEKFKAGNPDGQEWDEFQLLINNGWWTSNEFGRAIRGDLGFVSASIMLILAFLAFQSRVGCSLVGSRLGLTVAGGMTVGLGLGVGYGLGSLSSPYTPPHSVLPFVVAGIGADDLFIVLNEFSLTKAGDPIEKRMSEAMRHGGPSMLTTTLTDFLAFMIGSTTSLPALSSFTIWAAFAILGVFFATCTFFTACLVLDYHRQEQRRVDCCCCIQRPTLPEAVAKMILGKESGTAASTTGADASKTTVNPSEDAKAKETDSVHSVPSWGDDDEEEEEEEAAGGEGAGVGRGGSKQGGKGKKKSRSCMSYCGSGGARKWLRHVYAPFLLHPVTKVVVLVSFAVLTGVAGWGASQLSEEFRQEWFIPPGSELLHYNEVNDEYFSSGGPPVWAYVGDWDPFKHQSLLPKLATQLKKSEWTADDDVTSWWNAFVNAQGGDVSGMNRTTLHSSIRSWYASPAASRYENDIVFKHESSTTDASIEYTRISTFYLDLDNTRDEVAALQDVRSRVANAADDAGFDGEVFAFSFSYLQWEQAVVIPREAIQNIGLAILAVAVIVLLVVADPSMSIILTLLIAAVLTNILGYMTFWDVALNGVSVVNLVLAIGVSIDYAVHIGHAFVHKHGTRDERAAKAISEMGLSVLNGGFSTFLAVVVLAGSVSYIFDVFFRFFFLSVIFGLTHGLILLPVVLSFIGPDAHAEISLDGHVKKHHHKHHGKEQQKDDAKAPSDGEGTRGADYTPQAV